MILIVNINIFIEILLSENKADDKKDFNNNNNKF